MSKYVITIQEICKNSMIYIVTFICYNSNYNKPTYSKIFRNAAIFIILKFEFLPGTVYIFVEIFLPRSRNNF